jgi:hypothetical protein
MEALELLGGLAGDGGIADVQLGHVGARPGTGVGDAGGDGDVAAVGSVGDHRSSSAGGLSR